jgi:pimeloyl-ACP methyl ester carboxylesterase
MIEPFKVQVSDATLADLRQRLERVRWAHEVANDDWAYGTSGAYLKELVAYWRDGYDWRAREARINALPQFRTTIDGVPIHFVHVRGKGPKPMPLVLTHGWPWTFWDFQKVIGPLTDPAAYGGDPADAFDVVVPSLPGYAFSSPLMKTGLNCWNTGDLWVQLMERLGYPRFGAHGGDWGAMLTAHLGHRHADRLIGTHFTLMTPFDIATGGGSGAGPEDFGPDEQGWRERGQHFFTAEAGYYYLQCTKPQTIAFALEDSPVGLCAWILEKRRTWSDCGGNVESRFSKDDLLDTVMLYWITQTYGSSARYYYEFMHNPWVPTHERMPRVEAPTGVAVFLKEVFLAPRRWAERYYNLKRWTVFPSGGHFAPMEEPQAIVGDLRAFFGALR